MLKRMCESVLTNFSKLETKLVVSYPLISKFSISIYSKTNESPLVMPLLATITKDTVNSGYSYTKCFMESCDYNRSVTISGVILSVVLS